MSFKSLKHHFGYSKTNKLLFALTGIDVLFIGLHALLIYLVFIRIDFDWSIRPFLVNNDDGWPEFFQYIKFFIGIVLLIYLLIKTKQLGFMSWILLFLLMLLDDALKFHEQFGEWVVNKFNYQPALGLRAQDLGELTYMAIFGFLFLFFLIAEFIYGNRKYRKVNLDFALIFALLVVFGIGVDMLHSFIDYNRYTNLILTLTEDGGEMIVLSLFIWYIAFVNYKLDTQTVYLHEVLLKRFIRKK